MFINWLTVSILARFILGSSAVFDKLLLKKSYPNPFGYTFWLGIIGLAAFLLLPFGFENVPTNLVGLALFAGAIFSLAMLFQFIALERYEATKALILLGTLAPIFALISSSLILNSTLTTPEFMAFFILVVGGVVLFFTEEKRVRLKMLYLVGASAFFLGLADVLAKAVFLSTNFVTGFFWLKMGGAMAVLTFLLIKKLRQKILHPEREFCCLNKKWYLANRAYAGLGSLAISYAIFLGPPSLVNATTNFQYIFILIGGWLILKERFAGPALVGKIAATIAIFFGMFLFGSANYLESNAPDPARPIVWGVTFSQKFSESMGLDWKENYKAVLEDLGAKNLRLVAYWDKIEPKNNRFDFADLDHQMKLAEAKGAKVILAVGQKVPRWPECHFPGWTNELSKGDLETEVLDFIKTTTERYKGNEALLYWQVENEPFLPFGICPRFEGGLLDREIKLVKTLDPAHLILTSDSGEFSVWFWAAQKGGIFGTTIYRRVQNKFFGEIEYPLTPEFFRLKEKFSRFMTGDYKKKYIVVELGAEPWLKEPLYKADLAEQLRVFDLKFFRDTIEYAKAAGFNEYYLWGAEWWYWLKEKQGHPEFWEFAKELVGR